MVVGVGLAESVTVSVAVKGPVVENAWAALAPVAEPPSLKLHEKLYGLVPPVAVAVKVTGLPTVGEDGTMVKSAVRP